jgi:hypothetical protein
MNRDHCETGRTQSARHGGVAKVRVRVGLLLRIYEA